jgi:hypothetical protein
MVWVILIPLHVDEASSSIIDQELSNDITVSSSCFSPSSQMIELYLKTGESSSFPNHFIFLYLQNIPQHDVTDPLQLEKRF